MAFRTYIIEKDGKKYAINASSEKEAEEVINDIVDNAEEMDYLNDYTGLDNCFSCPFFEEFCKQYVEDIPDKK